MECVPRSIISSRLEEAARALELMTGIYEHAARAAATHRGRHPRPEPGGEETETGAS
jgi:hypothetical protein